MNYFEQVTETVKYKTQAEHYMCLLQDIKGKIQIAMDNRPEMKDHFMDVMKNLELNGVVSCFDKRG